MITCNLVTLTVQGHDINCSLRSGNRLAWRSRLRRFYQFWPAVLRWSSSEYQDAAVCYKPYQHVYFVCRKQVLGIARCAMQVSPLTLTSIQVYWSSTLRHSLSDGSAIQSHEVPPDGILRIYFSSGTPFYQPIYLT